MAILRLGLLQFCHDVIVCNSSFRAQKQNQLKRAFCRIFSNCTFLPPQKLREWSKVPNNSQLLTEQCCSGNVNMQYNKLVAIYFSGASIKQFGGFLFWHSHNWQHRNRASNVTARKKQSRTQEIINRIISIRSFYFSSSLLRLVQFCDAVFGSTWSDQLISCDSDQCWHLSWLSNNQSVSLSRGFG